MAGVFVAQDGGGEQGGVNRARLADGQRAHRHAAGHLHAWITTSPGPAMIWIPSERPAPAGTSWQPSRRPVRRAAGGGNDDFQPARGGRGAHSNNRSGVRWAEMTWISCGICKRGQLFGRVAHRFPVGLAAHDDAHQWMSLCFCHAASLDFKFQIFNPESFRGKISTPKFHRPAFSSAVGRWMA